MADGHSIYHITETLLVPRHLPIPLWQMATAFIISQRRYWVLDTSHPLWQMATGFIISQRRYWCLLHLLMLLVLHLAATASVAAAAASLLRQLMLLRLLAPAAAPRGVVWYSSGRNASHWPVFQPMSRLIFSLHVRRLLLLLQQLAVAAAAATGRPHTSYTCSSSTSCKF